MSTNNVRRLNPVDLGKSLLVDKPKAGPEDQALVRDQYVVLPTEQVRPYEDNPRQSVNEKYDDIKASFRTGGIDSIVLTVTQRPGQKYFICTFGGGTRLKAIKELLAETGDSDRYGQLKCIVQPYRDEKRLLAGHIAENTQRGEMTFWDLATAFQTFRQKFEEDRRQRISDRELETLAQEAGLHVSRARLNVYTFATTKLDQLACRSRLTFQAVAAVQPRWNLLERLASLASVQDEGAPARLMEGFRHALFEFDADFERNANRDGFPVAGLLHALDAAAATALCIPPGELLHAIDVAKTSSQLTWGQILDTLRGRAPNQPRTERVGAPQTSASPTLAASPAVESRSTSTPQPAANEPQPEAREPQFPAPAPVAPQREREPRASSSLRAACYSAARLIAHELEFADAVKPLNQFFGYWVEPLQNTDPRNPAVQWWPLLAMFSGQLHPDVMPHLPVDSLWIKSIVGGQRVGTGSMPHPSVVWCNVLAGDAPYGRDSYERTPVSVRPRRHSALVELVQSACALVAHDPASFAAVSFHLGGAQVRKEVRS